MSKNSKEKLELVPIPSESKEDPGEMEMKHTGHQGQQCQLNTLTKMAKM